MSEAGTMTSGEQVAERKARMPGRRVQVYHPNPKGSGAALQLELRLNVRQGERYDCFFLDMAPQKTCAVLAKNDARPATFDWENKVTVKLGFADICEMVAVLEGRGDQAGSSRGGIYHQNGGTSTVIRLEKYRTGGFLLGLSRKSADMDTPVRVATVLSESEALGIRHVLSVGLCMMSLPRSSDHTWMGE